tara:strand:+ start:1039 stop:1602 length:564 start_codon:yes stop_codon:yes gene_type:complete
MKDILDVNVLEDLNNIINFNNIKLLEKPQIKENTTILKIICNKSLKCSLKKFEKLLDNSLKFIINFDLDTEKDYYELIINKKINKIVNQLNINNTYNIGVKLLIENKIWMLQSIEISDSDFETIEEDIVDYHEIREDLLLKLNIRSNSINKNLGELNLNLNKLNELKNELENNFRNTEIENYYKLIN